MSAEHWHVLGGGAMGCLFAAALHKAGLATTLVVKQRNGLPQLTVTLERDNGKVQLQLPVSEPADSEPISHLLVTTKAYDVCSAVQSLAHRLGEHSQVLLLANGMGYAEQLCAALPGPRYYSGTSTAGAYRVAPYHIRPAGAGLTCIGPAVASNSRAHAHQPVAAEPRWFTTFSAAHHPCRWDPDIRKALWLKLAINCAINPLTALHHCKNGKLATDPQLAETVAKLCDEIMLVSAAAGYGEAVVALHRAVGEVIAATAENQSSMLQDVLAGRRTEIDYITGYFLNVAHRHGLAAPENEALFTRILAHAD
jgi:2-dehydropantoate 2-reductase